MKKIMIVLLLASAGVWGEPPLYPFGVGTAKCSTFNKADQNDKEIYYQWVSGAISYMVIDTPKPTIKQIRIGVNDYCKQFPKSSIDLVAFLVKNIPILTKNRKHEAHNIGCCHFHHNRLCFET